CVAVADGERMHGAAALQQILLDETAFAACKALACAPDVDPGLSDGDAFARAHFSLDGEQVLYPIVERDACRIDFAGRAVRVDVFARRRQRDAFALDLRARFGHLDGLGCDAIDFGLVDDRAGRESPRAVSENAHGKT